MNRIDFLEKMDFTKSFETLVLSPSGPISDKPAEMACSAYAAKFDLDDDLSPLFPYINAVADRARFYEKPVYIQFVYKNRLCAFYPWEGAFMPIGGMAEALEFLQNLLDFIGNIFKESSTVIPSHKKFNPCSALAIFRLLPGSNCGDCGYKTCMAFAAALSRQYTSIVNCPYLSRPLEEKVTFPVFDREGNVAESISFATDSGRLHQKYLKNEARIQVLQRRLLSLEKERVANFDAANSILPAPLTKREIEVLRLIGRGATNKEISAALQISQHTVKSHVIHIFDKIGVNDRAQASAWGALHGVL